jgi:quinol monooxygenase YgiN
VLKIQVEILPHKQYEFEQAIQGILQTQPKKTDNTFGKIYKDFFNPNLFCYVEEWDSNEKLQFHLESDDFHALLGCMKVLGEIMEARIINITEEEELKNCK